MHLFDHHINYESVKELRRCTKKFLIERNDNSQASSRWTPVIYRWICGSAKAPQQEKTIKFIITIDYTKTRSSPIGNFPLSYWVSPSLGYSKKCISKESRVSVFPSFLSDYKWSSPFVRFDLWTWKANHMSPVYLLYNSLLCLETSTNQITN